MKLLILGAALIAGALAMLVFSYLNPTTLFIGGTVCLFLGIIDAIPMRPGRGASDSASDAEDIANLNWIDRL